MKEPHGVTLACNNTEVDAAESKFGCIIDASNLRRAIIISGSGSTTSSNKAFIEGVVFQRGWAIAGGAIGIDYGATVELTMCTFHDNYAWGNTYKGGAVFALGGGTKVDITATVFWENVGDHGATDVYSHPDDTDGSSPTIEVSAGFCLDPYTSETPWRGNALSVEGQTITGDLHR